MCIDNTFTGFNFFFMKPIRYLVLLFLSGLNLSTTHAQFHDNHWLLGYETAQPPVVGNVFGLSKLSFYTGSVSVEGPIEDGTDHYVNNASISNREGDLIAYTDGLVIMSSEHKIMVGGDSLDRTVVETNQELRYKSTDAVIQGTLFLPYPGHPDSVLLFYTGDSFNNNVGTFNQDLSLAIINTVANGGAGKVMQKEIPVIVNDSISYGNITAAQHANGRDWWLIINDYRGKYYYPILIDPQGVHVGQKIEHSTSFFLPGSGGQAKFSPDGTKYCVFSAMTYPGSWINLFDFDRCTGTLFNQRTVEYPPSVNIVAFGGISFSPSSRFLYHTFIDTLFQYDLQENDLLASREKVLLRAEIPSGGILRFFQSQLAPDGKIYFCTTNTGRWLNAIHHPDEKGLACMAQERALRFPTINSHNVPNHPNYRLGPLDGSPCDTLGIDNLPRAWWRYEQDTLDPKQFDFHDLSFYEPGLWSWDFGDGNSSTERHPVHTYATPGTYEVCLTVSNSNGSHTHCKTISTVSATHNPVVQAAIQVGPNPFRQQLLVTLSTVLASPRLRLFDLTGRLILDQAIVLGINELDTLAMPAGAYFWQVSTSTDGVVKVGKVVKMQ